VKDFIKAPYYGAFFIAACLVQCALFSAAAADCAPFKQGAPGTVSYVYDGDTLKLETGGKVRLIGINTPEIGYEGEPDEPFAATARRRLTEILSDGGNRIFLRQGKEERDRYARYLAHVYDARGRNITEILLKEGLGLALFIPPNLVNSSCYKQAEESARTKRRGLWSQPDLIWKASDLTGRETGFHLLRGVVDRIGKGRRSIWLELRQGPAIRIDRDDWEQFDGWRFDELEGRRLEVRGWLYRTKGRQRLQVRHPAAIERL
jgi:endonuclease YncB( thermonuclease family)